MILKAAQWGEEGGEGTLEGRYYPDSKLPVYVVDKEVVEDAMRFRWRKGMRVIKKWESFDGLIDWQLGTVIDFSSETNFTQWRMLQVCQTT